MVVSLRPATMDDIEEMMPLFDMLYREDIGPDYRDLLAESIESNAHQVTVAIGEGEIVGAIVGSYRLNLDLECRTGHLDALAVGRGHQGRGIGRALTRNVAKWARAKGCTMLQVHNGRQEFFEPLGFEQRPVRLHETPLDETCGSSWMIEFGQSAEPETTQKIA
ncbi:MAG: GNAT family N-acetyltransferase [Phycisphaerae bacterium]|nr:GNAT family N-acetyltransferase [Phycisphaerae bacterium]